MKKFPAIIPVITVLVGMPVMFSVASAIDRQIPVISKDEAAKTSKQPPTPALKGEHAPVHRQTSWFYVGEGAAHHWGDVDQSYAACKTGQSQSPINISRAVATEELNDLDPQYQAVPLNILNNGHTIHVDLEKGGHALINSKRYRLVQMHFHTPSEHYIDGAPYAMEAHLVHADEQGQLAVVGIMLKLGEHQNPAIEKIWAALPGKPHEQTLSDTLFSASEILPANLADYRYDGSLTTPPCSEQVSWHVLKQPVEISRDQLVRFQMLFPVNARPIQPLNGRQVKTRQ